MPNLPDTRMEWKKGKKMKNLKFLKTGIAVLLALITGVVPVSAQTAVPTQTIEQRLGEIEQEVQILKRLKEVEQEINLKKEKETPVVTASKSGFGIKSKDGNFDLKIRGYIQADGRFYTGDDRNPSTNTFTLRRVRPVFQGTLFGNTDFRIMPDFATDGTSAASLQDAYIDFREWKKFQVKAGKFKSPFSLERLQSGTATTFIERAFPSSLAGNRDIGISLHGEFFDGALDYEIAALNGATDGASITSTDVNDAKDVVARIFSHPFKNGDNKYLNGLGLGIAGSYGLQQGTSTAGALPTYRSIGQSSVFSYRTGSFADGERVRFSPQAYYYLGPIGLLSEFTWSNQDVRREVTPNGPRNDLVGDLTNTAWHITGSYVLTGENATFKGVTPRYDFKPSDGKWGAFELVGRYQQLNIDDTTFTRSEQFAQTASAIESAQGFGVGLNWYLNNALKFQVNYEKYFFDGGSFGSNRESEDILFTRFQVNY